MKKRIIGLILGITMIISVILPVYAYADSAYLLGYTGEYFESIEPEG